MTKPNILQGAAALLLAGALMLCSILAANAVQNTNLYRQSRVIGSVITQDAVGIGELLGQRKHVQMLAKFAGAVTSAYINFELIPVNEAATFAVVFQSVDGDITIDKFEYQRKNLVIDGTATDEAAYGRFVENLRRQNHFDSVSGDYYLATDDTIKFKVICVSASVSPIGFAQ